MRTLRAAPAWKRLSFVALILTLATAAAGKWLLAAAGDLDPTFGTGGKVTTDIPACCDLANDVAVQADGKIVAAGFVIDSANTTVVDYDFALARYNPNGSLDSSFGSGGIVVTKLFTDSTDQAHSVAIQPDGKILVAGRTFLRPVNQFAVARYLPNGALDATFSGDGKATIAFPFDDAEAFSVEVQTDGRIVLVGRAWSDISGYDFAAARLMADGSLDTSFGGSGIVTTPISTGTMADIFSPDDHVAAAALQPDGRIIAAGFTTRPADGNGDAAIVRYLPDGSLDGGFGVGGKVIFNFYGAHADLTALAVQTDGKIVAGGVAFNPFGFRREFGLARLNSDGTLDPAFDDDGKVTTRIEPFDARMTAVALQADGRIVAVGGFGNDIALARYRTNGALDTSFSADGVTTTDLGGTESAFGLAIQADGKIVTAGQALPLNGGGNFATFLLLRYDGGSGQLEQTIDFAPLPDKTFGDPPFTVSATATSGLTVTFTASGACTIAGSTVTITGSGSCAVTASQDGNATYAPAPDVTRPFQVLNARTLAITLAGTGTGHVGSAPDGIDCGTDCSHVYQDGTPVTLVPLASAGSTFVSWTGDADCSDGTVTMNANVACTATFDRTASTTTVSSSLNPSTFGAPVTFTVVVSGSSPTGTVTIKDGAVTLASGLALTGGSASHTLSTLTTGTHTITAQYGGDTSHAPSTSAPLSQIVNKATPAVTLLSSRNPSAPGETVTLSGTVPAAATGTVTILDGAFSLGDATVSGGAYVLNTSTLTTGTHTLKARYNGDGNHLTAESAPLTQIVETANRAPVLTPIPDQVVGWGSLLTLPIMASDPDGDPVTLSLVSPPSGAIINGTQFNWTPTSTQVGMTQITVQASDGTLSSTTTFTVTVNKRATALAYLGPGSAAAGPVELSARLSDVQNQTIAGRTIAFQLGTQSATGTTDANGLATATINLSQPTGNISVTASFAGDAAYTATSSTLSFRVNAAPVIVPIASQSIPWGQTLTFTMDASDPDGGALTFSLLNAPAGVGLNFVSATRRTVVWTPTQAQIGLSSITIGVSDGVTGVSVTVPVDVLKRATAVTQVGPGASGLGPVVLSATLRDALAGTPLAGRTVTFALGSQVTLGTTNASGVATAAIDIAQPPQTLPLVVSFAGDGLFAPTQAGQPFLIYFDTDGDGIRDEWEINGVDINGDGTIELNLPAMGANPRRRDIFIEADWMVKPTACVWLVCWTNGGVLQPQKAALDELVRIFAIAPMSNPDGSIGIALHVDGGPNTIMNPVTGQPWGAMSRAGVVPYFPSLGMVDPFGNYDWGQFDALKQTFFDQARRAVFHYVIYADTLAATSAGGISRGIPAADFALAAGHPSWNGGMTIAQERSLFMHELGHNLSLHHGGGDDINYKPNYHSVLNYRWSLIGVPPDNRSDYSRLAEPTIEETLAGDVNGDGRIDTLLGYHDWPHLVFNGGGIGDLQALPAPALTPMDPIDPDELRVRGAYARAGEGLMHFRGPSLLALNSGVQSLAIDVKNISDAAGDYVVTAESAILPAPVSGAVSVAAGGTARVTLPVNTTGLVPGEYLVSLTLRSAGGEPLQQQLARVVVVDLTVPENQQAARDALDDLAALPPDSALDPAVKNQIVQMFESVTVSWTLDAHVTGRPAFDVVYRIGAPTIGRAPGPIAAKSLPGTPLCEVNLLRAGKAATGVVRLQRPTGEIFEAPISGSWNESTRTFDGKWLDGKKSGGSIVLRIREP